MERIISIMKCNLWLCVGFSLIHCTFFYEPLIPTVPIWVIYWNLLTHIQSASCKYFKEILKDKLGGERCGKGKYDNDYDIVEPY